MANAANGHADPSDTLPPQRWRRERPEHFSTYVPRDLVRRLKVIAAIRDVPLWTVITDALEQHLQGYERDHGKLPDLTQTRSSSREG